MRLGMLRSEGHKKSKTRHWKYTFYIQPSIIHKSKLNYNLYGPYEIIFRARDEAKACGFMQKINAKLLDMGCLIRSRALEEGTTMMSGAELEFRAFREYAGFDDVITGALGEEEDLLIILRDR